MQQPLPAILLASGSNLKKHPWDHPTDLIPGAFKILLPLGSLARYFPIPLFCYLLLPSLGVQFFMPVLLYHTGV